MTIDSTRRATSGVTLVLGGTGKIGRRVVQRLDARGVPTRIGSRSATPAFDWHDPDTWDAALEGVTAAYVAYLPDLVVPGAAEAIQAFAAKAVAKGVVRMVLLSGRGEEEGYDCEGIIRHTAPEWTIVRAGWFMQNFTEGDFLPMILDGTIAVPARNIPEPFVDVNDIADVVVAALTEDGHAGQVYEVTGPRALTFEDLAVEISRAVARDVSFVPVSRDAFANVLDEVGTPAEIVWLMDYLFGTVLDGRNACVADGVQRSLGREPADFSDFARRVAARGDWDACAGDAAA